MNALSNASSESLPDSSTENKLRKDHEIDFLLLQSQRLANLGYWNYDKASGNVDWSDEMYKIYGVDVSFNTSNHLAALLLFENNSRKNLIDAAKLLFDKAVPFDLVATIVTPLKYKKWVRLVGYPVMSNDHVTGIMGLALDITMRKESEELLLASEEKFAQAFRTSPDAMVLVREEDMVIIDVNPNVMPLLGYSKDELIGKRTTEMKLYVNAADRELLLTNYKNRGQAELETEWIRKNKAIVHVRIHLSRIVVKCKKYMMLFIKNMSPQHRADNSSATLNTSSIDNTPFKLAVPTIDGLMFLRAEEILYCEAESNYTRFHLVNGQKFVASKSLKEFENLLPEKYFLRVHNSFIINLKFVKKFNKADNTITMDFGSVVNISRAKKNQFLAKIGYKSPGD